MKLFVGVDGGASGLRLRVVDSDGRVVGAARGGPASLWHGADAAAHNLRTSLTRALNGSDYSIGDCKIACALAGNRETAARRLFVKLMRDAGHIEVTSDSYGALLGAHGGKKGAIVIIGTGTVGLTLDARLRVSQVGGWGPVTGDEGGGFWIGREAVKRALRARDEGGSAERLLDILHEASGRGHSAILAWLRRADPALLASVAPSVLQLAEQGDEAARSIMNRAGDEIARLIRLAGRNGDLKTALCGGLAKFIHPWLPADAQALLVEPEADAVEGALMIARGDAPRTRAIEPDDD